MLPLLALGQGVAFGQKALPKGTKIAPVPADPLELATGQIQVASTPASREAMLQLLARARENYALRPAGLGYDLKVTFAVDSLGQTNYDGVWEMEDIFIPGQGLHWTAKAAAGYTLTRISAAGEVYDEGTASAVPLRVQEARGVLFDPLPSDSYASRESIRTSTVTFHNVLLTCVLLSTSKKAPPRLRNAPATGRAWEDSEECVDPQSGLLQLHSEAPGRYAVYDYSNGPQLGGHVLPRTVTVTEAGRVVSKVSVETLDGITVADPSLFVPTDAMKAGGRATAMTATTKISRVLAQGPLTSGMTVRPVCVFGLVTPTGQLVEAHSLQPSDPNSQAAVEDAKGIDFSPLTPAGAAPQQHFAFVIEKFISR
jgi:hypothetical protein